MAVVLAVALAAPGARPAGWPAAAWPGAGVARAQGTSTAQAAPSAAVPSTPAEQATADRLRGVARDVLRDPTRRATTST